MSEQEQSGVVFPLDDQGRRSTTATGKAVWADAVREVDPALAAAVDDERSWRTGYVARVVDVTAAGTRDPEAAVTVARDGLASLAHRMRFERDGGSGPVADAVRAPAGELTRSRTTGEGERERELVVPYRGQQLSGDALLRQLDSWAERGIVESSFAAALQRVVREPSWLDLRDRAFGLLGAGAELGPLVPLLGWGAHVAAVDLPSPRIWDRVMTAAHASAGTLEVPLSRTSETGADLLVQTPEVAAWMTAACPHLPLTVGSYAYADGARHVQVAVASDAVVQHVLASRTGTGYAELATPTDAYAVPADVVDDARSRWRSRGWRAPLQAAVRGASRGALYAPAYPGDVLRADGTRAGIADVLVPQQGPNYTLAKRLQRWRATVAQADGVTVSANVAPATRTRSVTKNRLLAAAYAGAGAFGVEVFAPETSRVLMAALLVHDLRVEAPAPDHPDDLLVQQAAHGGLWRVGYSPRSVLGLAAVRGLPGAVRG